MRISANPVLDVLALTAGGHECRGAGMAVREIRRQTSATWLAQPHKAAIRNGGCKHRPVVVEALIVSMESETA